MNLKVDCLIREGIKDSEIENPLEDPILQGVFTKFVSRILESAHAAHATHAVIMTARHPSTF